MAAGGRRPAELLTDRLREVAELGAFAEETTGVVSRSTATAALVGSMAYSGG
jgi:hypothetical protein